MPSARCRLARLVSIPGWRARSQSSKASISVDRAEVEQGAEAGRGGVRREGPGAGQLGPGLDRPGDDGGQGQVAHAPWAAVQDAAHAQLPADAENGGGVAVRPGPPDGDGVLETRENDAALEHGVDGVDEEPGQPGEVGDGAPSDSLSLPPGFADQDGGRGGAVGNDVDPERHGGIPIGNNMLDSRYCI